MALSIRIYGTVFAFPTIDELIDVLEEGDFEVTIETEDEDEDDWEELLVYESSLDGPIDLIRFPDPEEVSTDIGRLRGLIGQPDENGAGFLREVCDNCAIVFSIELPEEYAQDDNALVICSMLAQALAQKCDGFYCVDSEGFFDESGDLVFEPANDE